MTLYLIYFVFVFILIVLQTFLIPALNVSVPGMDEMSGVAETTDVERAAQSNIYSAAFLNFILIEGIFAGLATGKMAEASIVAGAKHSIILTVLGYTFYILAAQFDIASMIFPV